MNKEAQLPENNSETQTTNSDLTAPELPKKTLASWLVFPLAVIFFIIMLTVYELLLIVCARLGTKIAKWSRNALQSGCFHYLYVVGARFDIRVPDSLDEDRPYILVSNHQSMFDIPLLFHAFRNKSPRYISKKIVGKKIPAISRYVRTDGSALIERDNPRQALPAIKDLAKRANEENFAVSIFPEGTRSRDGKLKRFRSSGLKLLFKHAPDAVILPVAIDGSWKFTCYPKGPIPLGVKVSIWTGTPITKEGKTAEELVAECEQQVKSMLQEIRTSS